MLARVDAEEQVHTQADLCVASASEESSEECGAVEVQNFDFELVNSDGETQPTMRSFQIEQLGWFAIPLGLVAFVCTTIPWLAEGYSWAAWVGVACGMTLAVSRGFASSLWVAWLWCGGVLGTAFHWSPAAMAYTLSSSYAIGFAVAAPLFVWDGLRLALGFWLAAKLTRDIRYYWFAAAATTIFLEYVVPGVFPWKLGLTQLSNPWLIQGIDLFGASFSTFVVFAVAGALQLAAFGAWRWFSACRKQVITKHQASVDPITAADGTIGSVYGLRLAGSPVLLTVCCIAIYNTIAWQYWSNLSSNAPKIRIGLVQVDPSFVESTDNAREQTNAIAGQVDLVCWPESSAGNYDLQLKSLADDELTFQMSRDPDRGLRPWPSPACELLLGGKNYVGDPDEGGKLFVTAMLIDKNESIVARHDKRFLMPFGEYVPGEAYIPGLKQLFDMAEYVEPGKTALPIESSTGARIGTMLCYEDMVPRAAREMVANKANLLISLVNGSAFESHYTLYQHRLISHLRAIESRRYFVRCAATGETCVINPLGEIESRLPMQVNGAMVSEVGLIEARSFYSRFPWLLPTLGGVCLVLLLRKHRKPR